MKYGIYLGLTHSAICKIADNEPVIIKTDSLRDTMPTCVSFTRRQNILVGDAAVNDLRQQRSMATKNWSRPAENVFNEFVRTMGLDTKYVSSNMERSYTSEELCAEVIKTLLSFVTDEVVTSCVITVPAKYKREQIAATRRAAELAGIKHCEVIPEPIAASLASGLSTMKEGGKWLVFNMGEGSTEISIVKMEDGITQVFDSECSTYFGGRNLDYSIVDKIFIPYLEEYFAIDDILADDGKRQILRDALKYYAEQTRVQLVSKETYEVESQVDEFGSDDTGEELELCVLITRRMIAKVLSPVLQKAIDMCKSLLARNNMKGNELETIVLAGSSANSPVLRSMLQKQISANIDTHIDSVTAIAKGAAIYASAIDSKEEDYIPNCMIALYLFYNSLSQDTIEFIGMKLLKDKCLGKIPSKVFIDIVRDDKCWSSGRHEINEIGDICECPLLGKKTNSFTIVAYDDKGCKIPCFPNKVEIKSMLSERS